MKTPRGILDYFLSGHLQRDMTCKLTGNLGGENYLDQVRGPLNEGGMFAERNEYHLPYPPNRKWVSEKPTDGFQSAVLAFI